MKKILSLTFILLLLGNVAFAGQYAYTKSYKLNQYDNKGRKIGYTKVYYKSDKANVTKVERYNTKGRRTELYR